MTAAPTMRPEFDAGRLARDEYIAALEREVARLHRMHLSATEQVVHLGWELVATSRERDDLQRAHDGLLAIVDGLLATFGIDQLEDRPELHLIGGGKS